MKDKKEQDKKRLSILLYGILWLLVMMFVSSMAYCERQYGSGTFFDGIREMEQLHLFHWLNPVTWPECFQWSIFYWIGVALYLIYEQRYHHDRDGEENGSAKWNDTMEEFNAEHSEPFGEKTFSDEPGLTQKTGGKNLNNQDTPPVPGNPNMIESELVRLSTADMKTHLNNNVFIVGGAGTGKSRFFIKPNVLQMNCSYVVTDPSGELLKSMHNVLADNGYKIKVFNLVDMRYSCKYNPFKYVKSETDVSILVDCFMSNTTGPDQKSGDPFWDKSEKALLSALLFYLVDIADAKYQKFSTILWMVQLAQMDEDAGGRGKRDAGPQSTPYFGFSIDMPLDELLNGDKKIGEKTIKNKDGKTQTVLDAVPVSNETERQELRDKIESSLCLTNYKTFKLGGTKTLKSILISAAVRLNPFSIPAIQNLTDDDNVELEKVGDELTCFFAIIPQTNSTFNFLISMLFSQMFEALYFKGAQIPNSRLPYHVRFLLDEFANIGKIPEFPQKISTCRKYNISTTIVLQSIAQIKMLYKDDYETIIGNCDTAICLGTNEQTTADYFSKKLGVGTITTKSRSISTGKSGGNSSFSKNKRELMLPDEIMTMPFDECIVMMRGINPFHDHKYPLEKHPQYKYTGDGDKSNFYFLEKDSEFLCVGKEDDTAEAAMESEGAGEQNDLGTTYQPKPLDEVLGEALANIPEEDGYYLIQDMNKEDRVSVLKAERQKLNEYLTTKIEEGKEKTVLYNGELLDPNLVRPLLIKAMNEHGEFLDDIAIACDAVFGDGHLCSAAAKDKTCNVVKVFHELGTEPFEETEVQSGTAKFEVCKAKKPLAEDAYNLFKEGCRMGYQAIVAKKEDDDDGWGDDYMDDL